MHTFTAVDAKKLIAALNIHTFTDVAAERLTVALNKI